MKTQTHSRFEKATQENLSDFIVPSFIAHINRASKQERRGISKPPKFPKKGLNN
jgi:hypothetical protein